MDEDMSEMRAILVRWFHLIWHMWRGDVGIDGFNRRQERILVACTCGKVFWKK
jgi:hypothetical protein